jgi:hypothetical protein
MRDSEHQSRACGEHLVMVLDTFLAGLYTGNKFPNILKSSMGMIIMVFWDVTVCDLVDRSQCFIEICCLHLYPEDRGSRSHNLDTHHCGNIKAHVSEKLKDQLLIRLQLNNTDFITVHNV